MNPKNLFFNHFGRLRSGWRFAIFLFLYLFFSFTSLIGAIVIMQQLLPDSYKSEILPFFVQNIVFFLCAVIAGGFCGKFFEALPFRALGWTLSNDWLKHLVSGLACGVFSILLAGLICLIGGGLKFQLNQNAGGAEIFQTLLLSLLVFIVAAAAEETLFRGYLLQTLTRANLFWFALILTSIMFASAHINNPGANPLTWVNTFLAGILLAAGYAKTRTLWFPFGLHLMWNWVQGPVLGINVSGIKALSSAPLLIATDSGPAWLTGGETYGIEAGAACTIALVIMTLVIWFLPFLKPTEEMLALTSSEKPFGFSPSES